MNDQDRSQGKQNKKDPDPDFIPEDQVTHFYEDGDQRGVIIIAPVQVKGIKIIVSFIIEQSREICLNKVDYQPDEQKQQ